MGRLPKNGIHKSFPLDSNILKTRHRHADTKYRSKVQYLYSKLKEMSQNGAAKDSLLSVTLLRIQSLENEIIQKVGSDEMKNYQEDFVNFLLHEEALWKIKDTVKWWRKVEEALNSDDFIDNERTDFTDSSRSKSLNLQQKNITSNTAFPRVSSCCSTRKISQASDRFSARRTKSKKKFLAYASDFSESSNVIPCFPKFNENLFIPHEEGPDSLLSFEEQNYFSNEILAEPVGFENNLF
ncbi:hypothetical protein AVEN_102606-1 [Araneus ventricosus]|uniref:Uncharacterized protein n=1 Tax=Araneus ventricosus TaxID=182803 RepID=A0A4Y2BJ38_ARAVE|nr:hypothetical protein AVEN_102606-1 [Araneus ventricosus]